MKVLVIKVDPNVVPPESIQQTISGLMNAKTGSIILAHTHMKFEMLEFDGDNSAGTMFAITDKGKKVTILYDPREEVAEQQKRQEAKEDFGKMH